MPPGDRREGDEPAGGAEALERGRRLFAASSQFLCGAAGESGLPPCRLPEVAFAGRSNVGKSSLINALAGRKALARTSATPGRTREINFFTLGGRLCLVDLPGYGYARAERRKAQAWQRLVRDYLRGRPCLRRLFLLIDARHGLKPADQALLADLDDWAVSTQGVLTKADKPKPDALETVVARTVDALAAHPAAHPELLVTSARSGLGIERLRAEIAALAADEPVAL